MEAAFPEAGTFGWSARSARDRERLRPEVLARLGWRLHRIWSPDWFRDPEGGLRRLLEALERARTESPSSPVTISPALSPPQASDIAREKAAGESSPRHSKQQAAQRKIEHISREEIRAAVLQVVEASAGIPREDLPTEVGRLLGRVRVTRTLRAPIEAVIQEMVETGALREQGEFLLLHPPGR